MQLSTYKASVPAAIAIGLLHAFLLMWCWGYIAMYSPVPRLLTDIGLSGVSWRVVLWLIDMLTNTALSLPAAYFLIRLKPRNIPLFVAAAVIPVFTWQSSLVFFGEIDPGVSWAVFVPGWAMQLLMVPLAVALILGFRKSRGA